MRVPSIKASKEELYLLGENGMEKLFYLIDKITGRLILLLNDYKNCVSTKISPFDLTGWL